MKNNLIKKIPNTLTKEQYEQVAKAAFFSAMVDEEKEALRIDSINYEDEKNMFLKMCGKTQSKHTRKQYKNAIAKLEKYTEKNSIGILHIKPSHADDFCMSLRNNDYATKTINTIISSVSSFFSFLERRYTFLRNPFRGTKTRPAVRNKKKTEVPTKKELDVILNAIKSDMLACATIFMIETGVRVGSLSSIEIKNGKYFAHSKGRDIKGSINIKIMNAVKKYKLDTSKPFENINTEVIRVMFYRITKNLFTQKKTAAPYSVHDLRHYFAVREYKKDKDIYALKEKLNHSSIAITELYLKSISEA